MSAKKVKVGACTTLQLAQTNCAFVSPKDFANSVKYVKVINTEGLFVFSIKRSKEVPTGSIWLNQQQRKWAALSLDQHVNVCPFIADTKQPTITTIELEAEFYKKKKTLAPYDSDHMSLEFLGQFRNRMISVGERFVFGFQKKKPLVLIVKSMEGVIAFPLCGCEDVTVSKIDSGVCNPNAMIIFNKAEGSGLNLVGKYTGEISGHHSMIIRDWDWQNMGIGGLDRQINAIFRQAFLLRIVPPELLEPLGYKHVKGILLKGVPGTGKTILAVQIAKMMNSRKPKLFNACDISKRYLGESNASIREIFFEAQEEEKEFGSDSGLHLLIFDDIDFFRLKQYSTVFNELLSQIDSLNNILVIWTNRKYLVDKAFLYPGRIEVQIELGLPNKSCRAEILQILTARMMEKNRLSFDVNLSELAELTENFTGADIQGLIRAAQARALAKVTIQKTGEHTLRVVVDREVLKTLKYCRSDFIHALETRNKPIVGSISNAIELLEPYLSGGIISWGAPFQSVFDDGLNLIQEAHCGSGLVSVLLEGLPGAGKTAIAAQLVKNSEFPFVQICSPINLIDMSESEKCSKIHQVFDHAYSSELSCIFIDNIELILGYTRIGPIYSKAVLETLLMLLNKEPRKGHKLLVICTSSRKQELEKANILPSFTFTSVLHVPNLTTVEHLVTVLNKTDAFSESQIVQLTNEIGNRRPCIGIKQLLHIVDMTEFKNMDKRVNYFLSKLESVLSHPN